MNSIGLGSDMRVDSSSNPTDGRFGRSFGIEVGTQSIGVGSGNISLAKKDKSSDHSPINLPGIVKN